MAVLAPRLLGTAALLLCACSVSAVVLRTGSQTTASRLESYSFARFLHDFSRAYTPGSKEYAHRASVFDASLAQVRTKNAQNVKEGRLWRAGVHPYMDWTVAEREALMGYKPPRTRSVGGISFLHSGARALTNATAARSVFGEDAQVAGGGLAIVDGPNMRDQGSCGSCWAISAVEAVEAQLQRQGIGRDVELSAQALVDCVPNPQHCGGKGGCEGATGELAYAFMRDYGIPVEKALPYQGETQQCPETPMTGRWAPATQRAMVSGWTALPSNQAEPLKQALVQRGPVVVAVDGKPWFEYEQGIFDGCQKDSILGHAVLAKGFGEESNTKYWLIQNSWSEEWGEHGHIRLLMHDDEDSWCGTDRKPEEGLGCDGGPKEITVCGACGLLYDPIIPEGVRLESIGEGQPRPAAPASSDAAAAVRAEMREPGKSSTQKLDDVIKFMES